MIKTDWVKDGKLMEVLAELKHLGFKPVYIPPPPDDVLSMNPERRPIRTNWDTFFRWQEDICHKAFIELVMGDNLAYEDEGVWIFPTH